jgi:hypothetical protein
VRAVFFIFFYMRSCEKNTQRMSHETMVASSASDHNNSSMIKRSKVRKPTPLESLTAGLFTRSLLTVDRLLLSAIYHSLLFGQGRLAGVSRDSS